MDAAFAIPTEARETATSLPMAKDLSHHLNRLTRNRQASSLKELYKYMSYPGMITMAGGIPHPQVFPFETLSASILPVDAFPLDPPRIPAKPKKSLMSWLFPTSQNSSFTIPKYASDPKNPATIQLSTSLQYQAATGPLALPLFLREYVAKVYKPAYADWDVLINVGATDGWAKICSLFLEFGDAILVEEWTYPGAENTFLPYEAERVAIKMDAQGLLPDHLESVLSGWDEEKRGKRRPRVLYTIPTGQNPTGATMMAERKKQIYDIYIIICEDEPYYCLGATYEKSIVAQRLEDAEKEEGAEGNEAFIKALPPSFLAFDTDGRTFSKTSAPGSRLGWITTSPLFIERLTRATEASTQAPSGFATALTTTMLQQWGFEGYIRWLRGIKATYKMRKTWLCDSLADEFDLEFDTHSALFPEKSRTITGYAKRASSAWDEKRGLKGPALITFIPPTEAVGSACGRLGEFFEPGDSADIQVLFAPGWGFDAGGDHAIGGNGFGYYRLAFSIATYEETRSAMKTFSKVLTKFFRL
ncbi:hypothetical protein CI109_100356 [Kwoniella shandongensis]|uniref:Aminotransferase class I/classII large domain-containing protein n=1 Tax=Kwoniella shandongensis TaxID=1734106 RepID=A0AAJ8LDL6_9TREE